MISTRLLLIGVVVCVLQICVDVRTPPVQAAPPTPPAQYVWKRATATVFWVGERASSENGYIHNRVSAWDEQWQAHFGGVDAPQNRCGYRPCGFSPKQNPFYVALPYGEYTDTGRLKKNARTIPWYTKKKASTGTLLQGRWVEVRTVHAQCFGQWMDVGPFETDDLAYVFGTTSTPKNSIGTRAGIDVSPALRDCLQVGDVSAVAWRFVDAAAVPRGPWHSLGQ